MKNKIIFLLFVLFSNVCLGATVDSMPEKVKTFTDNLETVSATFKQTKILPESTKQFISTGHVKFVKNIGFTWHMEQPSQTIFTSTLSNYCVNGVKSELSKLPYFYKIQSMIDKMLNGDMNDFLYAFNVDYVDDKKSDNWTMFASPRQVNIHDIIQDLTIYGSTTDLNKIIMTYNDGTIVIWEFTKMKTVSDDEIAC